MQLLQRVVVEAPAKINLFLDIAGRREDGYHLLDTVMQTISLRDLLVIGRRSEPGIRITCSRPGIPEDDRNLVHRAVTVFAGATGVAPDGIHIHIDKSIPPQAGLGGGSADAAAALVGLNALNSAALSDSRLHALALTLGADVPFLIDGGCARAQGIGERLSPFADPLPICTLLIAKPAAGISTQEAYSAYDSNPQHRRGISGMLAALAAGDLSQVGERFYNVFELACPSQNTTDIKRIMIQHGALGATLSGSGSAVAGLFYHTSAAGECAHALSSLAEEVFLCQPLDRGANILYQS